MFDGFAGSGTTGLAALLCENPPQELRDEANRLGLNVRWGARNAVLYEVGALGAFVASVLTNPPEPQIFQKAAEEISRKRNAAKAGCTGRTTTTEMRESFAISLVRSTPVPWLPRKGDTFGTPASRVTQPR